jgi:myosin heavy subunit
LPTRTVSQEFGVEEGAQRVIRSRRSKDGDFPDLKIANDDLERMGAEGEASAVDDLIRLTHLHEPAILHTLELRYWR